MEEGWEAGVSTPPGSPARPMVPAVEVAVRAEARVVCVAAGWRESVERGAAELMEEVVEVVAVGQSNSSLHSSYSHRCPSPVLA